MIRITCPYLTTNDLLILQVHEPSNLPVQIHRRESGRGGARGSEWRGRLHDLHAVLTDVSGRASAGAVCFLSDPIRAGPRYDIPTPTLENDYRGAGIGTACGRRGWKRLNRSSIYNSPPMG